MSQLGQEATFHIDHIVPVTDGGATIEENLALACVSCSLRKGARRMAADPSGIGKVPLFHPRSDVWGDHFQWQDERIVEKSATGRATVNLLKMNRPLALAIRREERILGRHPPRD